MLHIKNSFFVMNSLTDGMPLTSDVCIVHLAASPCQVMLMYRYYLKTFLSKMAVLTRRTGTSHEQVGMLSRWRSIPQVNACCASLSYMTAAILRSWARVVLGNSLTLQNQMAATTGLEPVTISLTGSCSANWATWHYDPGFNPPRVGCLFPLRI